jgi:sugar fermentation stimulation protein A
MKTPSTPIDGPLTQARFLRRPNRFLLQVRLEDTGKEVEAHMADPGRLRELLIPEKRLWLRPASKPERKTSWTAVLVESPDGSELISLDSTLPNRLIAEALRERAIDELSDWELVRAEVKMGRSRFDFLLSRGESEKMVLEVKSVTLVEEGIALFPDAVTERGARHVRELAEIAGRPGWKATVLFVLQRPDAEEIRAARSIDPKFSAALSEAKEAGVRVLGRRCKVLKDRVELGRQVPAGVG